jgi:D-alanyl-D-alanine carboxypeptidase
MTPSGILERAQPRRPRWRRWAARMVALVVLAGAMTATAVVARDTWDRTGGPRVEASPGRHDIGSPPPPPVSDGGATLQQPQGDEGDDGVLPPLDARHASRGHLRFVRAKGAILIDPDSGSVLWALHDHRRLHIASVTKLMTALLAVRGGGLSQVVTVRRQWLGIGGSSIYLVPHQRITVRTLLYGLLMVSGNDAANVLAIHRARTVRRFVAWMNAEAGRLGLEETHYSNPSGLRDAGNVSSAHDLADLSRYVLAQPLLAKIVRTKTRRAPHHVTWVNHNHLLFDYPDAIGLKTGYTVRSGSCLAAAARRHGHTLVAILLDARGDEFPMAERLLDWGFAHRRAETGAV